MSIFYTLSRYPKDGDSLDSTVDVTAAGGQAWADLLATPLEQLVNVYPLTREHTEQVRELTGITLDLENYEYFLEPGWDPSA
ncbi:hypothetical protein ABZT06_23485 [Streptomyces sp. NPDC005483]|uniref:DUF7683 domain-containing protein n=1 Tax=Streptomyces sp. NPDC005483 TaxID=3154882 RepID=UPI0033A124B6